MFISSNRNPAPSPPNRPQPKSAVEPGPGDSFQASGYDTSYLDRAIRPQDDFYHFALGGYEKSHPIPADKSGVGIYSDVREAVTVKLHAILDELAQGQFPAGSNEQKLKDFYASGLDLAAIDAAGSQPIQPELQRIAGLQTAADVQSEVAHLHGQGLNALFGFGASTDPQNSDVNMAYAGQGGLSLPTRDYYLDEKKADVRETFRGHVTRMLQLLGDQPEDAAREADAVLRIETRLAQASLSPAEMRNPQTRNHPMTHAQLAEMSPNFSWDNYLQNLGVSTDRVNIVPEKFFRALSDMMADTPVEDWKSYLRWTTLNGIAGSLSQPFRDEKFEFSRTFSGVSQQPERWKSVVSTVDGYLGDALGQKFVERHFTPEAKAKALEMLSNVKAALRESIETGWISDASKKEALAKVDSLGMKVGYPDHWRDYADLPVGQSYAENILNARAFDARHDLAKIDRPVDRSAWHTSAATVNAFYNASRNDICFPAGRLQPPFFDAKGDEALNYGATGATMGHEMSHGFDDSGSQYDWHGQLRPWFAREDQQNFTARANAVASQMSEYSYDGQQNNGKLVMGEAIADQGGVELGYKALSKALGPKLKQVGADGFTAEQRYFLGYALCRAGNSRPEAAHAQMTRDTHPLGLFRVNAPLSNEPAFFAAFGAQPGDPMVRPPEKRNHLWEMESR